ncbi:MAG TPA: ABC transporter permease subunit [Candidatus Cybelea sp.]|nr:ABC transporter permease subunit [Candidatus Cybelea sp.]
MTELKRSIPLFWGLHARPGMVFGRFLGIIPIAVLVGVYMFASHARALKNPNDKLMPSLSRMYDEMKTIMTVPDKRSGKNLFWEDTKASLKRLALGISIAAVASYFIGILMGMFPGFRALLGPLVTGLSNVNPLAVLVIVLVALGVGESSKVFLVAFGIGVPMMRTIAGMAERMPNELTVKALTLGASQYQVLYRIIAPQMLPRLIDLIRVSLGAAWIFVIAAEAVAATEGLGYRIYLQQRYMNMALIIPYVIYISLLAYSSDLALQGILKLPCFRWYCKSED